MNNKISLLSTSIALILGINATQSFAATHVTDILAADHGGKFGTITFDDWGFVGPDGRGANDFEPINGFNADSVGQVQHVVTRDEDGLTPDAPMTVNADLGTDVYGSADLDATVTFFHWAYTTVAGSTFSNMLIDTDGDYFIAQNDMSFMNYEVYKHNSDLSPGDTDYWPDGDIATKIAFFPYTLSDAKGWCGSIMATNPGALQPMAGQVQFDFAFDVYFQFQPGVFTYSSTEIVKDFQMRSYGELSIDIQNQTGTDFQVMTASAVVNNTNPGINNAIVDGAPVDSNYYNLVSFMGGGVLDYQSHCGVLNPSYAGQPGIPKYTGFIDGPTDSASCETAGGNWQGHIYTGYAYILRADGIRVIEAMDYAAYPDLTDVPTVVSGTAYNNDELEVSQPIADLTGTPNTLVFVDQSGALLDTVTTSNTVTLTGLTRPTVITIAGGEYKINSGDFTADRGVVVDNDTVQIRVTTPNSADSAVNAALTVGSLSDTFSVTTSVSSLDTDGDGVIDALDNCDDIANADQQDTDLDHFGNVCDSDFNNDGIANSLDTGLFKNAFFTTGNAETDLNSDNIVNSLDLGVYKQQFTLAPGPSGLLP
ncbi:MAG: thrombospondin type 3 repeat-containing protein [Gammaproteobacteria bacterium]|nr:thrombospondin type 3 repeat-containing protein [Gammaproteobacteria bacterium]MCK5262525.1 thrombospondin type 3 repeat-containing protein [Gammaproteobacteria bacterium]